MDFPVQRSITSGSTEIITNSSALLRALWMDIIFHVLIFSHNFSPCTVHSCEIRWWWDITGQESQSWWICSGTKPMAGTARTRTYMGKLGGGHSCLVLFCLPKSRIAEAVDAVGSTTCRMRDHETRWRWLLCRCELFIQQFRKRFILSKPGAWWIFHVSFRFKRVHVHPPSYIHHKPTRLWSITQYISLVYNRHTQIYNDLCIYIYIYIPCAHTYIHTCNTMQYNTIQNKYNTIQYNTIQHNTTQYKYQYNTIQIPIPIPNHTIQYNTKQYNHTYIHT